MHGGVLYNQSTGAVKIQTARLSENRHTFLYN